MFHPGWRELALADARSRYDLVVVGGGITGCGIALDAAQRGLRTMLVERGDIAAGTSSRSSKLIHGGLRYLKQMQLRITRLACRERDRMVALDPHLVHPIRFLYPAYHGDATPGWQVDLGLWMYDQLTGRPEKHTQVGRDEVRALAPGLRTEGLDRALEFGDAMADDARLTLAVATTAHHYGAGILTRAELLGATRDAAGRIVGVVVRDLEDGAELGVEAAVVVNATGVWSDVVRGRLGLEGSRLRPSRGAHLVLPSERLPLGAALTLASPDDGRPVFLVPHPEGVLVGTTDLYHAGDLDDPRPTAEEVRYLLRAVTAAFPRRPIDASDVRAAFAGLRPILDTHADTPSEATREEDLWEEDGALSVAGGKLTTWRSTAEQAVDAVLRMLPEARSRHASPCATEGTPVGVLAPADLERRLRVAAGVHAGVAVGMARRLAGLAWPAAELARGPAELVPVTPDVDVCAAEIRAHARWNAVLHLDDLLLRRIRLGMWRPERARQVAVPAAEVLGRELGWDAASLAAELDRFEAAVEGWSVRGVVPSAG